MARGERGFPTLADELDAEISLGIAVRAHRGLAVIDEDFDHVFVEKDAHVSGLPGFEVKGNLDVPEVEGLGSGFEGDGEAVFACGIAVHF